MCIAILNKNNELSLDTIETCWDNNPQGAGLLWADKRGFLRSFKTYYLHDFYRNYLEVIDEAKNGTVILHFRIATQGFRNMDNLHPFINQKSGLGFVHNGIISQFVDHRNPKSDTALFNEKVVSFLPKSIIHDKKMQRKLAENVRTYNKLIFMNHNGDTAIINEAQGVWDGDNWFSNDSYCSDNRYHGHIKL
jgi:predicted glutamine amidotransferase